MTASSTVLAAAAAASLAAAWPQTASAQLAGTSPAPVTHGAHHAARSAGAVRTTQQASAPAVIKSIGIRYQQNMLAADLEAAAARARARGAALARAAAARAAAKRAAAALAAAQQAAASQQSQTPPASQAPAESPSPTPTVSGTPQQIAAAMLASFGWSSSQFSCLDSLWNEESGWSVTAENPSSGAYGIPQALPGSRMASAGPDWQSDATTQIKWGLEYIQSTYGSPCAAWSHEEADGWY